MKIDVEDVKRINLGPNDILLFRIPKSVSIELSESWIKGIEERCNLKGRVIIVTNDVEVESISKDKANDH